MPKKLELVPFEGELPKIKPGDRVECRDMGGRWRGGYTAFSGPRYDTRAAFWPRCHLTVSVGPWHPNGAPVNWPAEDVRLEEPDGI